MKLTGLAARAVRFSTLDALCRELACQPGDLLENQADVSRPDGMEAESGS